MIESEKAYNRKKMGFSQGVDISFLSEEAQQWVEVIIEEQVRLILTEEKPKEGR